MEHKEYGGYISQDITNIRKINDKTEEGQLLMMALACLTVQPAILQINGKRLVGAKTTPWQMLAEIQQTRAAVYGEKAFENLIQQLFKALDRMKLDEFEPPFNEEMMLKRVIITTDRQWLHFQTRGYDVAINRYDIHNSANTGALLPHELFYLVKSIYNKRLLDMQKRWIARGKKTPRATEGLQSHEGPLTRPTPSDVENHEPDKASGEKEGGV